MAKRSAPNAWMITTIVLGVLLLLSFAWNGVLTLMLVSGGGVDLRTGDSPQPTPTVPTGGNAAPTGGAVQVSADDDPVLGDPDAPVVLVEFSDYECPFCGRFYRDTLPQIKSEYIDTGKAKLVYRDFPLSFHPRAMPSAIAAECVQEIAGDDAYFEMHDLIFDNQQALSDANLRSYAEQVGVDMGDWDECFADADGSMRQEVQADVSAGQTAGVSGTPTVFVNGQKIVGAQPYAVFKAAIDAQLQ